MYLWTLVSFHGTHIIAAHRAVIFAIAELSCCLNHQKQGPVFESRWHWVTGVVQCWSPAVNTVYATYTLCYECRLINASVVTANSAWSSLRG